MARAQSQVLKVIEKYPCGIPKTMTTKCPGKHETTNYRITQGPCFNVCPIYSSELHELFYHKIEDWWEKPEGIKTEAERVRSNKAF
jgi:hypothetical protein